MLDPDVTARPARGPVRCNEPTSRRHAIDHGSHPGASADREAGTRNVLGATCTLPGARGLPQRGSTRSTRNQRPPQWGRPRERSRSDTRPSLDARGVIRSMDQETTPAATTAEPSDAPTRTDGESTTDPRRNSGWGKVQVKTETDEPAKPAPAKTERSKPEPAKMEPAKTEPAKTERSPARSQRSAASDAPPTEAPERPKPQRQPRQPRPMDSDAGPGSVEAGPPDGADPTEGSGASTAARRRRRRGGRGRGRGGAGAANGSAT